MANILRLRHSDRSQYKVVNSLKTGEELLQLGPDDPASYHGVLLEFFQARKLYHTFGESHIADYPETRAAMFDLFPETRR